MSVGEWLDSVIHDSAGSDHEFDYHDPYAPPAYRAQRASYDPVTEQVAAISVGIVGGRELLDLRYAEDSRASVDMNVVMTGEGRFIEVQGTGEEATFSEEELHTLLGLARRGVSELTALQQQALRQ